MFIPLFWITNQSPFFYQIISEGYVRYPILSIMLLSLFLWQKIISTTKIRPFILVLFIFIVGCFLRVDPYYTFTFLLPLLVAYFLTRTRKQLQQRSVLLLPLLIIVGISFSYILADILFLFHIVIFPLEAGPVNIARFFFNISLFFKGILLLFNALPAAFSLGSILEFVNIFLLVVGIIGLIIMFRKNFRQRQLIGVFIPLMAVCICVSYIVSNQPIDIESTRYMFPLPFLLVFGQFTILNHLQRYKSLWTLYVCILIISAIFNFLPSLMSYHYATLKQRYPTNYKLLSILQKQHLKYGYARDYWDASMDTFFSQNTIQIRAVRCLTNTVAPRYLLTNSSWYDPTTFSGQTFLLLHTSANDYGPFFCTNRMLISQFGHPTKNLSFIIQNEPYKLLIFPYNIAKKL